MFTVTIAGVRGNQIVVLKQCLGRDIRIRAIGTRRLLRIRKLNDDLVLCTRFIGHKHQRHLRRIVRKPVVFCPGGIRSWAKTIRFHQLTFEHLRHLDSAG